MGILTQQAERNNTLFHQIFYLISLGKTISWMNLSSWQYLITTLKHTNGPIRVIKHRLIQNFTQKNNLEKSVGMLIIDRSKSTFPKSWVLDNYITENVTAIWRIYFSKYKILLLHWDDPEGWDREGGGRGVQDEEHM